MKKQLKLNRITVSNLNETEKAGIIGGNEATCGGDCTSEDCIQHQIVKSFNWCQSYDYGYLCNSRIAICD